MPLIWELLHEYHLLYAPVVGVVVLLALSAVWSDLCDEIPYRRIPLVGKTWWDLSNKKARERFSHSARALFSEGFAKGFEVFQTFGATSPLIILHPKYIDEIKNNPLLDFVKASEKNFFSDRIPGFEGIHQKRQSIILVETVRVKITQALGALSIPLSVETAQSLQDILGSSNEWVTCKLSDKLPYIVARVSSLVFVGETVCRDPAWLEVAVNYTVDAFMAARTLRMWPSLLRPLVHWFIPKCRNLRRYSAAAHAIIAREVKNRAEADANPVDGKTSPRTPDALDWADEISAVYGINIDRPRMQIGLSLAAIHTTSYTVTNVMYDLAAYPEYLGPLREEIKEVLAEDGILQKKSLSKLKLLDSVIKESQRLNPVGIISMNRYACGAIELSNGTKIPNGATIAVSGHTNRDDSIYPNASTYDGYRFYKMRQQPGHEHRHQLVTTTNQCFDFGHGIHACPGRFFAANEIKILMVHLLLKYEWKFKDREGRPANFDVGTEIVADPTVELLIRAREPGFDLAALGE
ncbi:Cytochrome P450 monooxygenase [Penicillium ucsense]|uniref:Cytochrome P450 monooxygenase n=1 Tax=Penicillium ucsense TaxID=2839758 RepID=A0A8J8WIX9_9EURO|nr:Cytochrome P450 monooxygenase [Penicillium ucsense]KAF7734939.1 Cytochrome P450 monooxygenase [Penicillium ucsense]